MAADGGAVTLRRGSGWYWDYPREGCGDRMGVALVQQV